MSRSRVVASTPTISNNVTQLVATRSILINMVTNSKKLKIQLKIISNYIIYQATCSTVTTTCRPVWLHTSTQLPRECQKSRAVAHRTSSVNRCNNIFHICPRRTRAHVHDRRTATQPLLIMKYCATLYGLPKAS